MKKLLEDISNCTYCADYLMCSPRPVIAVGTRSRIAIVGQAPGRRVFESGIPWDDKSGERLRKWLGVSDDEFYDHNNFAIVPMGFCYPGTGKNGDLAPSKECAPLWHDQLWSCMPDIQLTLLIGQFAQKYYLGNKRAKSLTETVRNYQNNLPKYLVLPHPSPRNNIWLKKNPWFEDEVISVLQEKVLSIIST